MEEEKPVTYQIYELINTYSTSKWFRWDDIADDLGLENNIMRSVLSKLDQRDFLISKKDQGVSRMGRPTTIYRRVRVIDIKYRKPAPKREKVVKVVEPPKLFSEFDSGFYRFCFGGDAERIRDNLVWASCV